MKKLLIVSGLIVTVAIAILAIRPAQAVNIYVPVDIFGSPLHDGDLISASGSDDPDVFIIKLLVNNEDLRSAEVNGYKRLFLNPTIFNMYSHLGGFSRVRQVTPEVRDTFMTSGLFRNCETNDQRVWATEVTAEDAGIFHHVQVDGTIAVQQDRYFFSKVFCINSREENWYPHSITPYTSLSQVPVYGRPGSSACYYQEIQCFTTPFNSPLICPIATMAPTVRLTQPNGGETYPYGVPGPITWQASVLPIDRYLISLIGPGAGNGFVVVDPSAYTMTSIDFTTLIQPSAIVPGSNYRIRIEVSRGYSTSSRGTIMASDESDTNFSLNGTVSFSPALNTTTYHYKRPVNTSTVPPLYSVKMTTGFLVNGYYIETTDNGRQEMYSIRGSTVSRSSTIFTLGYMTTTEWNSSSAQESNRIEIARSPGGDIVYYYNFGTSCQSGSCDTLAQQATSEVPQIIGSFMLMGRTSGGCYIGGCSSQICSDQPNVASTCEYQSVYVCAQQYGRCERQYTGQCGWSSSSQFITCYQSDGASY